MQTLQNTPNINTCCQLIASSPLTKAKPNFTWNLLWFPSLPIFPFVFLLLSPEQLFSPSPKCLHSVSFAQETWSPWQSKDTLVWPSFCNACCCTIFLTAVTPQNLPFHVSTAFSAQPCFPLLEWNGNSVSEDITFIFPHGSSIEDRRFFSLVFAHSKRIISVLCC